MFRNTKLIELLILPVALIFKSIIANLADQLIDHIPIECHHKELITSTIDCLKEQLIALSLISLYSFFLIGTHPIELRVGPLGSQLLASIKD